MFSKSHLSFLIFCLIAFISVGCSTDPVNQTHQGTLEAGDSQHPADQSFYDEYKFKAEEGWPIVINMNSDAFDALVQIRQEGRSDTDWMQENDDVEPGKNLNAQLSTTAPATGTYVVWANSRSAGETGAYTLTIQAQPAQ